MLTIEQILVNTKYQKEHIWGRGFESCLVAGANVTLGEFIALNTNCGNWIFFKRGKNWSKKPVEFFFTLQNFIFFRICFNDGRDLNWKKPPPF